MNNSEQLLLVKRTLAGDRLALENLVRVIQPKVLLLAQRFLANPYDADEASQDIMLKVISRLSQFEGRSQVFTWVYKLATNHLIDMVRKQKRQAMSFADFSQDLAGGLDAGDEEPEQSDSADQRLLAEVRIGCTLAMLQCLSDDLRISYILGEILELNQDEAIAVLEIAPATYRKRLSRARQAINDFMLRNCGLLETQNACRCHKRVATAKQLGRVNVDNLIFTSSLQVAQEFPEVLAEVRRLEDVRRAAALFRAQQPVDNSTKVLVYLKSLLDKPGASLLN